MQTELLPNHNFKQELIRIFNKSGDIPIIKMKGDKKWKTYNSKKQ
jgi:hypothetical protein